jgi:hypothetical protein
MIELPQKIMNENEEGVDDYLHEIANIIIGFEDISRSVIREIMTSYSIINKDVYFKEFSREGGKLLYKDLKLLSYLEADFIKRPENYIVETESLYLRKLFQDYTGDVSKSPYSRDINFNTKVDLHKIIYRYDFLSYDNFYNLSKKQELETQYYIEQRGNSSITLEQDYLSYLNLCLKDVLITVYPKQTYLDLLIDIGDPEIIDILNEFGVTKKLDIDWEGF